MDSAVVAALARHILTALAGGAAVKYGIDGGAMDAIVSGAAALAGVSWSVWDKRRKKI
jgi:hypothetical protein